MLITSTVLENTTHHTSTNVLQIFFFFFSSEVPVDVDADEMDFN